MYHRGVDHECEPMRMRSSCVSRSGKCTCITSRQKNQPKMSLLLFASKQLNFTLRQSTSKSFVMKDSRKILTNQNNDATGWQRRMRHTKSQQLKIELTHYNLRDSDAGNSRHTSYSIDSFRNNQSQCLLCIVVGVWLYFTDVLLTDYSHDGWMSRKTFSFENV